MNTLVVVESPTKAKTLAKFLGSNYQIEASMGHIRDLPKAEIGVDTTNFEVKYIIPKDKQKRVNELKKLAKSAKSLYLATDPDREGEAIAWHLAKLLTSPSVQRVVFHEITEEAVKEAFLHPRDIDLKLVDAQQARRVLDRLVGYKLSPLLWKKVKSGLSAGRVQSVALRLIVEREKEIEAFKPVEYWTINVELTPQNTNQPFLATLFEYNGKKIEIKDGEGAAKHLSNLQNAKYLVSEVLKKEVKRYPAPPFTTSTLQQAASIKLGLTAKKTMITAQHLYERGLITYMRTDSVSLSQFALTSTRSYIEGTFGPKYLPESARIFKTKSKVAQEAHEAIRPTDINLAADRLKTTSGLTRDHLRLYDLIWKRLVASQMSEAVFDQTTVEVMAGYYTLRVTGSVVKFDGWLKLYGIKDEEDEETIAQVLPELKKEQPLLAQKIIPEQHFTEAAPRFNEASLIKKLEELGIGRPSTYAPTLSTIQERYYVEKKERKFFPTELGIAVIRFLMENFPDVLDLAFTAMMEDNLDQIAQGERDWKKTLGDFYYPFEKKVVQTQEKAQKVKIEATVTDKSCPNCGKNLVIKFGRFGKFLACSGFPDCKYTENLTEKINIPCLKCGGEVVLRKTKKRRPFYGCSNWPKCDFASWTKPKATTT